MPWLRRLIMWKQSSHFRLQRPDLGVILCWCHILGLVPHPVQGEILVHRLTDFMPLSLSGKREHPVKRLGVYSEKYSHVSHITSRSEHKESDSTAHYPCPRLGLLTSDMPSLNVKENPPSCELGLVFTKISDVNLEEFTCIQNYRVCSVKLFHGWTSVRTSDFVWQYNNAIVTAVDTILRWHPRFPTPVYTPYLIPWVWRTCDFRWDFTDGI